MRDKLIRFLVSIKGRVLRVIAGMFILAYGFEVNQLFIFFGLIPLLEGVFDVFVIAPIFGLPFSGKEIRKKLK